MLCEKLPFEVGKIFATVEIVVLCVRFDAFICSIGIFNELPCLFIEWNLSVEETEDYGLVEESEDTISAKINQCKQNVYPKCPLVNT